MLEGEHDVSHRNKVKQTIQYMYYDQRTNMDFNFIYKNKDISNYAWHIYEFLRKRRVDHHSFDASSHDRRR